MYKLLERVQILWLDYFILSLFFTLSTAVPLHANLQVVNFERCKSVFHQLQAWVETAACVPSPIADDPSALPSPTPSPSSSQLLFLPIHLMPVPVCHLLYCTTVLFKALYLEINFFFGLLFMSCLCEKYYKPITVQYYIVSCVSWICRLTLLDLMNELDYWTHSQNRTHLYIGCFLNSLKNKDWRLLAEK